MTAANSNPVDVLQCELVNPSYLELICDASVTKRQEPPAKTVHLSRRGEHEECSAPHRASQGEPPSCSGSRIHLRSGSEGG